MTELARLSSASEDTLNVMLTGRSEGSFAELISRMIKVKGLEFDIVALKPKVSPSGELFASTMDFKQALLRDLVMTYADATELRIYEDRPKHVKGFRDFFVEVNEALLASGGTSRRPITAEVIQVTEQEAVMDPVTEVAEVQHMMNEHNAAVKAGTARRPYTIKRSVFYTGYIIAPTDIEKLKTLIKLPTKCPDHEIRQLANNILITPRPAPHSILNKVGGIGAKMSWKVTGLAVQEQRVWAARVQPTVPGAKIYTENHTPCVVLATRRQAKPIEASYIKNWQPVPEHQAFEFETTVGEKVLLRIDEEFPHEDSYEASFPNARNARKHPREEDFPPLGSQRQNMGKPTQPLPRPLQRQYHGAGGGIGFASQRGGGGGGGRGTRGGYGGFGRGRGNARGGGGSSGGRGRGRGAYRSLDDTGQGYGGGGMQY